ncbi:formylglycine-generating enzyme family protein [Fibrella aquatica]|uniref:formylglycine-generating enzyme family protein n=1 Tax=Fibrella aquatica TaxID=3242487 RepID=UPI00351FF505
MLNPTTHRLLPLWPCLSSLLLLCLACEPGSPKQFAYAPTITVYETEPDDKVMSAAQPPGNVPDQMVYVPGGFTLIGSEEGLAQEKPTFWVQVKPFLMDQHEVTVGQFRSFVTATGYQTEAEKFGDAGVFNDDTKEWELIKGTNWQFPYGPAAGIAADSMPVTQVSWHDAQAYAKWAGKRLPREIEWEHAARNGTNTQDLYPFGNELFVNGKSMANTWNGTFPNVDKVTDGFHRAAPVGTFGKSPLGLSDMAGNVWEWCEDPKMAYSDLIQQQTVPITDKTERVQRGGSYLCEPGWCHGYRVSGRSGSTAETSLMHTGFRCVKDI